MNLFESKRFQVPCSLLSLKASLYNKSSEQVSLEDIDTMFLYADVDGDGRISWTEFQVSHYLFSSRTQWGNQHSVLIDS